MNTDYLAFEAKSFYNAYLNLERIDQESGDMMFFIPMAVNGAFAIELALKTILAKLNIPYGKEHNLLLLFGKLPDSIQQVIWRYLAIKAPEYSDEKRRAEELTLISNVFVDWRYSFEATILPAFQTRFLSAFANATIWVMFSLGFNADLVPTTSDKTDEQVNEMIDKNRAEYIDSTLAKIEKKQRGSKNETPIQTPKIPG